MQYQSFPLSYDLKFEDPPIWPQELDGRGAAHGLLVGAFVRNPGSVLSVQWASVDGETGEQLPLAEVIIGTLLLVQSITDDMTPEDPRKKILQTTLDTIRGLKDPS